MLTFSFTLTPRTDYTHPHPTRRATSPPEHSPPPSPYISTRSTHRFRDPTVRSPAAPLSFAPLRCIPPASPPPPPAPPLLRRTLAAVDRGQRPDGALPTPSSHPYSRQSVPLTAAPLRHRAQQLHCRQRPLRCCPRRPRRGHRLHRCGHSPSLHRRRRFVSASSTFAACRAEPGLRNDSATPAITSGGQELPAGERRGARERGETEGGEAGAGGEMKLSAAEGLVVGVGSGVGQ